MYRAMPKLVLPWKLRQAELDMTETVALFLIKAGKDKSVPWGLSEQAGTA